MAKVMSLEFKGYGRPTWGRTPSTKICKQCKATHRKIQGQGLCTKCYLARYYRTNKERHHATARENYKKNKEHILWKTKKWASENKDKVRVAKDKYEKKHPERIRARQRLNDAIRYGKIRRERCSVCGGVAHAHHPDYSKPLQVIWLCPKHHKQIHAKAL